jgi:arylsulfatase A-like enzyme
MVTEGAKGIALSSLSFETLEIPDDVRPGHAEPPVVIPLGGPWKVLGEKSDMTGYQTRIPVRPRGLFFSKPPAGSVIIGPNNASIHHAKHRVGKKPFWTYNRLSVTLHLPTSAAPPTADAYKLVYPPSRAREANLNFQFSGKESAEEFVWTTAQSGADSLTGLLLPAPGTAAWDVVIPPAAELRFSPGLLPAEIQEGLPSDGVTLKIEVEVEGDTTESVFEQTFTDVSAFEATRVDLSKWAGQDVVLRFSSVPGASNIFDYLFIAEPAVVPVQANPRRVVIVFVDTLRPDHLATYGYERETSPSLDQLAENGVVFENARSVAPWTLPSTRTMLTGRHSEFFDRSQTLPSMLGAEGWASAMFAGNLYLAPNFGTHRDWGRQHVKLWPSAEEQVDQSLKFLEEQEGRDALLLVHFMDAHLPYIEPKEYRRKFAGDPTHNLGEEFHRTSVVRARIRNKQDGAYVLDRYDNNILYVNDQLQRLYDVLDDNDTIVYLSDHGEEFWEHRGYEHGHTLYDEVLRVPLVIKSPNMPKSRVTEPVSLLDVTPTILDLVGITGPAFDGVSLVKAANGDEEALAALSNRNLTFGRPLYGRERWGVLHEGQKWSIHEGKEQLFDLAQDAGEQKNLLMAKTQDEGAPYREYLADGLGREVGIGYRVVAAGARTGVGADLVATFTVPGGIKEAWVGDDPTNASSAAVTVLDDVATVTWHKGFRGGREVYVIPNRSVDETSAGVSLFLSQGKDEFDVGLPKNPPSLSSLVRTQFLRGKVGSRWVSVTLAIAPIPNQDSQALSGYDSEMAEMLQAMGYVVGDDAEDEDGETHKPPPRPAPEKGQKMKTKAKRRRPPPR